MRALDLVPISEFQLVTETIRRFRMGYVAEFGAPERDGRRKADSGLSGQDEIGAVNGE
jgi:hypothetical protein